MLVAPHTSTRRALLRPSFVDVDEYHVLVRPSCGIEPQYANDGNTALSGRVSNVYRPSHIIRKDFADGGGMDAYGTPVPNQ